MKIIILILLLPLCASAGGLDVFGYFEPQYNSVILDDEFYQFQSNKLRIDLEANYNDNVKFVANYDYITNHGKTEWNISDFLPNKFCLRINDFADSLTQSLPEEYQAQMLAILDQMTVFRYTDRNFLDNANMRLSFSKFDLTVGKQQISLGTGYAYNPVDVFNYKTITDPTYEQAGHNAIRLDLTFGGVYGMTAIYCAEENWEKSTKLLRLNGRVSHFDYSFYATEKQDIKSDYEAMLFSLADFSSSGLLQIPQIVQKRRLLGGDFVGEIFGLGIWGEGAYNFMENSDDYLEFVFGGDYTFDNQIYIMFEYYRNELFKEDSDKYTLNDWFWYLNGETKGLASEQLFSFASYPLTDLITLQNSVIYAISDQSAALVPSLNYNIFENVELDLITSIYFGDDGTAFSDKLGKGGVIRARVYF